jgi:hypothetical protein
MIFNHPILNKKVQIEAIDISTAGFSVNESTDEATLIPGMIIKGLTLCFAGSLCIQCDVQVIYRLETEGKSSRFGIAILDLDTNAYNDLNRIITKSVDPNAFFASEIDMDALWEFFFEAGFIYPRKYKHIRAYRQEFREIYTKLYNGKPEIAKHFISQKNGRIYGHISMIRAYERSWLIHHHVARPAALRAGFQVLRQITHYLNGMLRFPSTKTDYLMAYFRPENKFPDRVFGGFSRSLSNPRGCSMDLFAYLSHTTHLPKTVLSEEWRLREISPSDRLRLNQFYDQRSGGLLLRAMNLGRKNSGEGNLEKIYRQQGFFRRLKIYSFSYRDDLAAVMVENHSDPGLNLSELINSIIIFIVRPSDLPWNVLSIGIGHLSRSYRVQSVPLMIYPCDYVAREKIPYENKYQSWVIDVRYEDDWMKYMQKTFKAVY